MKHKRRTYKMRFVDGRIETIIGYGRLASDIVSVVLAQEGRRIAVLYRGQPTALHRLIQDVLDEYVADARKNPFPRIHALLKSEWNLRNGGDK